MTHPFPHSWSGNIIYDLMYWFKRNTDWDNRPIKGKKKKEKKENYNYNAEDLLIVNAEIITRLVNGKKDYPVNPYF